MTHTTFAGRWNLAALEDEYNRWRADPASVDPSWQAFFEGFELGSNRPAPSVDGKGLTHAALFRLIDAYRELGHLLARLDPLSDPPATHPVLELNEFGLKRPDLDRTVDTSYFFGVPAKVVCVMSFPWMYAGAAFLIKKTGGEPDKPIALRRLNSCDPGG